jgi:anaerobic magnesium-protoporphyrin IX monomethyl ester cyclase
MNGVSKSPSFDSASTALKLDPARLAFAKTAFVIPPTGLFCREDRCQSFFDKALIPTMRVPLEETESAGAVLAVGGYVEVLDAPAHKMSAEGVFEKLSLFKPNLIVVSISFGSIAEDLRFTKKLKVAFPHAKIGLRGAPCYVWNKEIVEDAHYVDFVVQGDYEVVFGEIVAFGLEHARGVTHRGRYDSIITTPAPYAKDLDLLPRPDYSSFSQALYKTRFLRSPQATIRVQRGCPFTCTYCLVHTVSGSVARHRSAESIADEMKALVDKGTNYFYLRADTFTLKRDWAIEVARAIKAKCPKARWVTTTRIECVDAELLRELRDAGCYGISFGIDVASETIGKKVKKPVSLEKAKRAMKHCDDAGIISLAYIMIGFIWDTPETLAETKYFVKEISPDLLTIHYAYPYPGTPYYEAAKDAGFAAVTFKAQAEPAVTLPTLSTRDLKRFGGSLLRRHYTKPKVMYSLAKKATHLILQGLWGR